MPLGGHGMLVGFLPKLLTGLRQVLAAWRAGLVLPQPSFHFVPHVLDWRQIGGHRGPSHHQHILMSEKIHDETRNVWSSIVLLKGHVSSLTTDEWQCVRSNNPLQVAVCIQIAINNGQGCPAMAWDATPHHHTPTAKRTSLSNACILVALAHPAVHHNSTIWMIQTKSRFIWEQYSFPFSQTAPQMGTWPPLAVWKRLRKCVTLMYWSCLCDVTRWRSDRGLSLPLHVVWKRLQRELMVFRWTPNRRATSHLGVPAWIIPMARWRSSVPKRGMLSARTGNDHL